MSDTCPLCLPCWVQVLLELSRNILLGKEAKIIISLDIGKDHASLGTAWGK